MIDSDRRTLLALGAALGLAPAAARAALPDLYRTSDRAVLLAAARALLAEDRLGTFITVDGEGRPRARTVLLSAPDADLTLWIGTRPGSRKLAQIAAHPQATVHVALDAKAGYASLTGTARAVTDPAIIAAKNPIRARRWRSSSPPTPAISP